MARIARRIAGIGASDLPDAAAFDAYVGPAREITVDQQRGIIALHDGVTPGGQQFHGAIGVSDIVGTTPLGRALLTALDAADARALLVAAPAVHNHDELYLNAATRFGASSSITNNKPALQTAINDIAARGGGTLVLPSGTLQIEDTVLGADGVSIAGQGRYISVIKVPQSATPGGGLPSHAIQFINKTNFRLSNFGIRGNRAVSNANSAFAGLYLQGCGAFVCTGLRISDVESEAIALTSTAGIGGCFNYAITDNEVYNTKIGFSVFKGGSNALISGNAIDLVQMHAIMVDDATAADTTSATAWPNTNVAVVNNNINRWAQLAGGGYRGILFTGQSGGSVSHNRLRSGGLWGASPSAAGGIMINSGENQYNGSYGISVLGNLIDTLAGSDAILLQGARGVTVVGNTIRNVFLWPTGLSGIALSLLADSPLMQGCSNNVVVGNTIEGNANTAYGIQLGASTEDNIVANNSIRSMAAAKYVISSTAAAGQVVGGEYGSLPPWTAGMRGMQWHSVSDEMRYYATSARWKPIGVRVGALPAHTSAQRGDLILNTTDDKLNIATNTAWVVVGTQA